MIKSEIVEMMSCYSHLPKGTCEIAMDSFIEVTKRALKDDHKVMLKGFMTLENHKYGERRGRHPLTGEVVTFPPCKVVKCRISPAFKRYVNDEDEGDDDEE